MTNPYSTWGDSADDPFDDDWGSDDPWRPPDPDESHAGPTPARRGQRARGDAPASTPPTPGPAPSGTPAAPAAAPSLPRGESQAQILLRLAGTASLFHDPAGRTYAAVPIKGHVEVHEVRSRGFRRWLSREFYEEADRPPAAQALQDALGILDARAMHDGPEEEVFVRVAARDDRTYIDLGDAAWRAVEVDAAGWRLVAGPPVRFRRPPGMLPLPEPAGGGTIGLLRRFVNLDRNERLLLIAWLAAALRGVGPFPAMVLTGEQGSAKSTLARLARLLVDPNVSPLRSEPKEVRDLMIAARNAWVVCLDNISALWGWLSDAICRLSTGGGFATRTLYSDDEEVIFDAVRPVLMTGITDFVSRGDLIDRAIFLHLAAIPEERRRPEGAFWKDFEAALPRLFGALLDAVAGGLRRLPEVQPPRVPRLADFAIYGEAVARALGASPDDFLAAYRANRLEANESMIEDSEVAGAVKELVKERDWDGTATGLLTELTAIVGDKVAGSKDWPRTGRGMSGALRLLAPGLRLVGLEVVFHERKNDVRPITIRRGGKGGDRPAEEGGETPSRPSPPSPAPESRGANGDGRDGTRSPTVTRPSPAPCLKTGARDGGDGRDGPIPGDSGDRWTGWEEIAS